MAEIQPDNNSEAGQLDIVILESDPIDSGGTRLRKTPAEIHRSGGKTYYVPEGPTILPSPIIIPPPHIIR